MSSDRNWPLTAPSVTFEKPTKILVLEKTQCFSQRRHDDLIDRPGGLKHNDSAIHIRLSEHFDRTRRFPANVTP